MGAYIVEIIIAVLAFAGTMGGAAISNRSTRKVMEYRIKVLEEKVDKHNQLIERTAALEGKVNALEKKNG
ncbi:MAG: hypothetical protein LIP02_10875, partial [Bacteroidales bacterium]|nr:hypothetical protein [Bacteroidales bacterium]